jgi:alpha-tubulin suppressor-like RCC1 family protein
MKETIFLNDIKIFFENNEKNKIEFENNNLIQMLKVKINNVVFKIKTSNIGCGAYHSFIYDNSF